MARSKRVRGDRHARYRRFRSLDGRHPLQRAAPRAAVGYRARRRRDAELAYFNFALAKEMGLVPESHPERLDRALCRAILDAFALTIINEYDQTLAPSRGRGRARVRPRRRHVRGRVRLLLARLGRRHSTAWRDARR